MEMDDLKKGLLDYFTDEELYRLVRIGNTIRPGAVPWTNRPEHSRNIIRNGLGGPTIALILRYILEVKDATPTELYDKFPAIRRALGIVNPSVSQLPSPQSIPIDQRWQINEVERIQSMVANHFTNDEVIKLVHLLCKRHHVYNLTVRPVAARNTLRHCRAQHCYDLIRELTGYPDFVPDSTLIAAFPLISEKLATIQVTPLDPLSKLSKPKSNRKKVAVIRPPSIKRLSQDAMRRQIFDTLTDEELWKIMLLVARDHPDRTWTYLTPATVRTCSKAQVTTGDILSSLAQLMGYTDDWHADGSILATRLAEVRLALPAIHERDIRLTTQIPFLQEHQPPPMPDDLTVAHPELGPVSVTYHAWRQFCVRYLRTLNKPQVFDRGSQSVLSANLRLTFERAQRERMSSHGRVIRTINNGFVEALFFRNHGCNMRFVVLPPTREKPGHSLLTAEIVTRGVKFVP